jgi:hypothetical protein
MSVEATQLTTRLGGLSPDRLFVIVSRLVALVLLVTVLSLLSPYFLTWPNFINVMRQAALQLLIAAGLTIVVLTRGIDLAIGARWPPNGLSFQRNANDRSLQLPTLRRQRRSQFGRKLWRHWWASAHSPP